MLKDAKAVRMRISSQHLSAVPSLQDSGSHIPKQPALWAWHTNQHRHKTPPQGHLGAQLWADAKNCCLKRCTYIYIYLKKQSLHDGWHRLCIIPAPLKPPDVKQEGPGGQDNLVFVNTQAGTMTTKNTNDNDDNEVDFEKRTNVLRAENWLSAASYRQLHPFQRLHLYLNTRTPPAATQNNTFYPLSASFSFI